MSYTWDTEVETSKFRDGINRVLYEVQMMFRDQHTSDIVYNEVHFNVIGAELRNPAAYDECMKINATITFIKLEDSRLSTEELITAFEEIGLAKMEKHIRTGVTFEISGYNKGREGFVSADVYILV